MYKKPSPRKIFIKIHFLIFYIIFYIHFAKVFNVILCKFHKKIMVVENSTAV